MNIPQKKLEARDMKESWRQRKFALSCISLVKMSEGLHLPLTCETEMLPSSTHSRVTFSRCGSKRQRKFAIINEETVFRCRDEMFIIPESTTASNAMELLSRPMGFGVRRIRRITWSNSGWGSVGMMEQGQDFLPLHALKRRQ